MCKYEKCIKDCQIVTNRQFLLCTIHIRGTQSAIKKITEKTGETGHLAAYQYAVYAAVCSVC